MLWKCDSFRWLPWWFVISTIVWWLFVKAICQKIKPVVFAFVCSFVCHLFVVCKVFNIQFFCTFKWQELKLRQCQLDCSAMWWYVLCLDCHRLSLRVLSRLPFNCEVTRLCLPVRTGTRVSVLSDTHIAAAWQTTNTQAVSCFYWQWDLYQHNWFARSSAEKSTLIWLDRWAIHPPAPRAMSCHTSNCLDFFPNWRLHAGSGWPWQPSCQSQPSKRQQRIQKSALSAF